MKNVPNRINECLVFQVHNNRRVTPRSIYIKLVQQFHEVLKSVNFDQRKDDLQRRRKITLHSFRRFVKTTISDSPAGSDYSEWFLGHTKSTYYVSRSEVRAEIYATKVMKYLTFLDYSMLKATGKTMEAKISEMEREKEIMSQKYEQEMKAMQEQIDHIIKIVKDPHTRARMLIKPEKMGLNPNVRIKRMLQKVESAPS